MRSTVELCDYHSIWATIERIRRPTETWLEAIERGMLEAMLREHVTQEGIADYLHMTKVQVNRRMQRHGLRPKDRKEKHV